MQDPHAHKGSRRNLLGDNPDPKLVEALSNETRVTAKTPPVFLLHPRGPRRRGAELPPLPRGLQEARRPCRDAPLSEGAARRRPGAEVPRPQGVAGQAGGLAQGTRSAPPAGKVNLARGPCPPCRPSPTRCR